MERDLIKGVSTAPGRVRTFLQEPKRKTMPHSCVLRVYDNDLSGLLNIVSKDLCGGAGVKVNLDKFQEFKPIKVNWGFYLDQNHPDYKRMTDKQRKLYVEPTEDDTIIIPEDSMGGNYGIRRSWEDFIQQVGVSTLFSYHPRVVVDLTKLRPAGTLNSKGLEASGALGQGRKGETSFLSIYEAIARHLEDGKIGTLLVLLGTLNETLRRGGFKRGIVCTSLDYRSPAIYDYLSFPNWKVPGGHKKSIRLDKGLLDCSEDLLQKIADSAEQESTFLEKIKPDRPDLYSNVCQGLAIPKDGICLIWRINLGMIQKPEDLLGALEEGTVDILNLYLLWRDRFTAEELTHLPSLKEDRQVALDIMGMASLLANLGITYKEFTDALHRFNNESYPKIMINPKAMKLVEYFAKAYLRSSYIADSICDNEGLDPLERIHTPAEPSQRHFTDCKDAQGYTTTRSIFPPFERKQRRVSDHEQQKVYIHNPDIEIASEVGAELNFEFACEWKKFVDSVGRSHGYMSFDSFEPITPNWLRKFIDSPLESKYYSESSRFDQSYLKKDSAVCELGEMSRTDECLVCAE